MKKNTTSKNRRSAARRSLQDVVRPTSRATPINVALPNTTAQKMEAIIITAKAVEHIARALISTNVQVTIANNHVQGAETGIRIASPESA